jgi:hypothetical protein
MIVGITTKCQYTNTSGNTEEVNQPIPEHPHRPPVHSNPIPEHDSVIQLVSTVSRAGKAVSVVTELVPVIQLVSTAYRSGNAVSVDKERSGQAELKPVTEKTGFEAKTTMFEDTLKFTNDEESHELGIYKPELVREQVEACPEATPTASELDSDELEVQIDENVENSREEASVTDVVIGPLLRIIPVLEDEPGPEAIQTESESDELVVQNDVNVECIREEASETGLVVGPALTAPDVELDVPVIEQTSDPTDMEVKSSTAVVGDIIKKQSVENGES